LTNHSFVPGSKQCSAETFYHGAGPPFFSYAYGIGPPTSPGGTPGGNAPPCGANTPGGGGTGIAKPIPRPAVFNPHLHQLLACRNPYLAGELKIIDHYYQ